MEVTLMQMHKQSESYGCGLYAVSNALSRSSFVTNHRMEISKEGNNLFQLNNWLLEDREEVNISPMYFNLNGGKIPESFYEFKPVSDKEYMPCLFDVKFSEDGRFHFVAGHVFSDTKMILFDSLREKPIETTIRELNASYHTVCGFYGFASNLNNNWITIVI